MRKVLTAGLLLAATAMVRYGAAGLERLDEMRRLDEPPVRR